MYTASHANTDDGGFQRELLSDKCMISYLQRESEKCFSGG